MSMGATRRRQRQWESVDLTGRYRASGNLDFGPCPEVGSRRNFETALPHEVAETPTTHFLICRKNALPRIALAQCSQVLTSCACLRRLSKPRAKSLPELGARSIELRSQSRVSAS